MDTNKHELLFKDEAYQVVGAAIEVLNTLGYGFLEKPYENAMLVELRLRNISVQQQLKFNISYKEQFIGEYIPDLVVYDKIIVEIKTLERITSKERSQVLNYLKTTGLSLGLILNFGNEKLEWERLVL